MSEFDLEKMRSIGTPRGITKRVVSERDRSAFVTRTEHADGRVDVTVIPDTQAYDAVLHKTGKQRGQVAEIREKGARP